MVDIHVRSNLPEYYICARESRAESGPILGSRRRVVVQVEAISKDHAMERLAAEYPFVARADWEILEVVEKFDENGKEHDIGFFGTKLPLQKH